MTATAMGYLTEKVRGGGGRVVKSHRVVVERALGHPLPARAEVHHINEDKRDNRPENLVACEDRTYHQTLHVRMEALRMSGHANWRRCHFCRTYDDPTNMFAVNEPSPRHVHRSCYNEYFRTHRRAKRSTARNR